MIKVSVLYPNCPATSFNLAHCLEHHLPLANQFFGTHPGYRGIAVEPWFADAAPGAEAPFAALCYFSFDSLEEYMAAFAGHTAELQGDIPKYTNIALTIQISVVILPG